MSDEKPFALHISRTQVSINGTLYRVNYKDAEPADVLAASLNSSVAARERKAAAKALRALAASIRCATGVRDPKPSDPFWRDYFATVAETQAAALEGGAT